MTGFEERLNNLLVSTFNTIAKYEEISLKNIFETPVTVSEAHFIEAIGKSEGTTVSELAALLNIAVPTATVAVKKLESKGYVQKIRCNEDARRSIITLTDSGKKVDRAHGLFHRRMVRNISGGFSETEKEVLLASINKLNEFFISKTI